MDDEHKGRQYTFAGRPRGAGAAAPDPSYFFLPVRSSATSAFSLRMNNRPPDTTGADHVNLSRSSTVHRLTPTYFFGSALARKSSPWSPKAISWPSATITHPRPSARLFHLASPVRKSRQRSRPSLTPYRCPS